jgi:hypothetical protein
MAAVTIRNLPAQVHSALKLRARQHNRSTEAEMRAILEAAVLPEGQVGLGTTIWHIARKHGVTDEDVAALRQNIEELRAAPERGAVNFD